MGDFDATVKYGEQLLVTTVPFCKLNDNFEAPIAGAISERNAIGSCIYNIRAGFQPFHDLGPVMVQKLIHNDFPSTVNDSLFGDIILRCWLGKYSTIRHLGQAIFNSRRAFNAEGDSSAKDSAEDPLLSECEAFLIQHRNSSGIYNPQDYPPFDTVDDTNDRPAPLIADSEKS